MSSMSILKVKQLGICECVQIVKMISLGFVGVEYLVETDGEC